MLLRRCLCLALCLTLWAAAQAEGVLLLTTSPSPPGRFVALEQSAREHGVALRTRFVEKIAPDELGPALWQGADLVLIDAPRQHIEDFVRGRLAPRPVPGRDRPRRRLGRRRTDRPCRLERYVR